MELQQVPKSNNMLNVYLTYQISILIKVIVLFAFLIISHYVKKNASVSNYLS